MIPSPSDRLLIFGFRNGEMAVRGYTLDGARLNPLPGPRPYGHPNGTFGLRDPSVTRYAGRYYLAATRAAKPDYLSGDAPVMTIAVSDDLVTWTHLADIPGVPGAPRNWAPEWFVDDDGQVYLYWSASTQNVPIADVTEFRTYVARATDHTLTAWSTPAPVEIVGAPAEVIDAQVTRIGVRYCMFVKDEVNMLIMRGWADSPYGPFTLDRTGNWLGTTGQVEGPQLVRMPDGTWRLFYDRYAANQLCFKESADLNTWGPERTLTYPFADLRHLGPLWITAADWQAFRTRPRSVTAWIGGPGDVPHNTVTPFWFGGGSVGDASMYDPAAPGRLTVPERRTYTITVEATWAANVNGQRSLAYRVNGGSWRWIGNQNAVGGGMGTEQSLTVGGVNFNTGDVLEVAGVQTSGGDLSLRAAAVTLTTRP